MSAGFGDAVSTAGDTNNDGYDDIVIGDPFWYLNSSAVNPRGKVFLYRGSSTGVTATLAASANGTLDNAELGATVFAAGDVNGDGSDEYGATEPFFTGGELTQQGPGIYLWNVH